MGEILFWGVHWPWKKRFLLPINRFELTPLEKFPCRPPAEKLAPYLERFDAQWLPTSKVLTHNGTLHRNFWPELRRWTNLTSFILPGHSARGCEGRRLILFLRSFFSLWFIYKHFFSSYETKHRENVSFFEWFSRW